MRWKLIAIGLGIATALAGCGTKTVSQELATKPGVVTGTGKDGYPVVKSITFKRPSAEVSRVLACMQAEVDGLTGNPVQIDGAVKSSGKAYASLQFSNYVAFAMTVRDTEYRFDRLANAGLNGPAFELMGSSYGTPENAYAALESIADRVSGCANKVSAAR
jgi:hypothetical protein